MCLKASELFCCFILELGVPCLHLDLELSLCATGCTLLVSFGFMVEKAE